METLIQISLSLKTFWMFFMTPSSISVHFKIVISDRNRNKIGPYHLLEKSSSWASVSVFENWPLNFDSCFCKVLTAASYLVENVANFYIIIYLFWNLFGASILMTIIEQLLLVGNFLIPPSDFYIDIIILGLLAALKS